MKINYPPTTDEQFTEVLLSFLSSLRPVKQRLTNSEIEHLTEFINLAPKYRSQMFSTLSKTKVKDILRSKGKTATAGNINIKLYSLIKKGYLKRDEDSVIVLQPSIQRLLDIFRQTGKLQFSLNFNRAKEENTTNN
jgi:hypothetical protein